MINYSNPVRRSGPYRPLRTSPYAAVGTDRLRAAVVLRASGTAASASQRVRVAVVHVHSTDVRTAYRPVVSRRSIRRVRGTSADDSAADRGEAERDTNCQASHCRCPFCLIVRSVRYDQSNSQVRSIVDSVCPCKHTCCVSKRTRNKPTGRFHFLDRRRGRAAYQPPIFFPAKIRAVIKSAHTCTRSRWSAPQPCAGPCAGR